MNWTAGAGGAILLAIVLWDAFETIVLPRRVTRRVRITRLFYAFTWPPFRVVARVIKKAGRRESFLSFYGPLSLIFLLVLWALGLVTGFALLQYAGGSAVVLQGEATNLAID